MPRRISRLGGTTLRRSFIVNAYSPAMRDGDPFLRGVPHEPAMLRHHAAVLNDVDASACQLRSRAVVADSELEPHGARTPRQCQDLARVAWKKFGTPEDVDHVDGLAQIGERADDALAQHGLAGQCRVDGKDAVAS